MGIMNHFKKNDHKLYMDEPWLRNAVEHLSQPLHPSVAAQLKAARRSALDQPKKKSRLSPIFLWGMPTLAGLVAIILSFGLWQESDIDIPQLQTADKVAFDDFSIIKASDDLEFYQNIEFLLWMEQADNGLTKG